MSFKIKNDISNLSELISISVLNYDIIKNINFYNLTLSSLKNINEFVNFTFSVDKFSIISFSVFFLEKYILNSYEGSSFNNSLAFPNFAWLTINIS